MQRKYGHICVGEDIENVWKLFNFSERNMKKINPDVISKEDEKLKSTVVGSTFHQRYEVDGCEYRNDVKITHYQNRGKKKIIGLEYYYAKKYYVNQIITLEKMGDRETKITCVIEREPVNLIQHLLFYIKKPQTVESYLKHIKNTVENN